MEGILDAFQETAAHPIEDEAVGGQQAQGTVFLSGLQRADPRVVVLGRELVGEAFQATVPEWWCHARSS